MINKLKFGRKTKSDKIAWLQDNGEMARLIRAKDWSKTPLGPIENWPSSLQTTLGVILGSRFAMMIWWGPELLNFYNDAYRPILRDKHPDALGMPASELWAEIWDFAGPLAHSVMEGGPATWMEDLQLFIKSGVISEETYFTFSYSPILSVDGKVGGMLNTVQETTIKVQAERQIQMLHDLAARASEAKSQKDAYQIIMNVLESNTLDTPFALLYVQDEDGVRLVSKTRHAKEADTWPLDKVVETSKELIVDDSVFILPLKRSGGTAVEALLVLGISPNRKMDDRYKKFFKATADQVFNIITNASAYEAETKRAEELTELDKLKTQFFTNISHEFRTPLTLILGPIADSLSNKELPKPHLEQLELVHRNALRLQRLVNSLLDFSSAEAGKLQAEFQPVDLSSYTRYIAKNFEVAMKKADLDFQIDCQPLGQDVYVDYKHWETIVLNLLSNALKYTLKGHVLVTLRAKKGHAELQISDSGSGIPESEHAHLFERFHRVAGSKSRTGEGSGIGLALIHELVKLHSGTITAKSELGKGTTFTVRVPFGKEHIRKNSIVLRNSSFTDKSSTSKAYLNEAASWFKESVTDTLSKKEIEQTRKIKSKWGQTILVIDDNVDMGDYIYKILNDNTSLKVEIAKGGREALKIIKKKLPSIIISDIMMPDMDGIALLHAVRKLPGTIHVPFIFLSARAGEHEKVEGIAEGVDAYLTKPFSPNELIATVRAQLDLASTRKQE